jgi:hypothetical protein
MSHSEERIDFHLLVFNYNGLQPPRVDPIQDKFVAVMARACLESSGHLMVLFVPDMQDRRHGS